MCGKIVDISIDVTSTARHVWDSTADLTCVGRLLIVWCDSIDMCGKIVDISTVQLI